MATPDGPWARPPRPQSRPSYGPLPGLVLLVAGAFGLWELFRLFPNAVPSDLDEAYLLRTIAVLVLVAGGMVALPRMKAGDALRNVALWTAVLALLVIGYTYRDEVSGVGERVRSELVPSYGVETAPHTLSLTAGGNGGFFVMGEVNGAPVLFLIDTGASDVVLSPKDAARVGIDPLALDYSHKFETAHGVGRGARAMVANLAVGPIRFTDVPVSVNQSPMSTSLLGMAFLGRLDSFEVRGRHLLLHWKARPGDPTRL